LGERSARVLHELVGNEPVLPGRRDRLGKSQEARDGAAVRQRARVGAGLPGDRERAQRNQPGRGSRGCYTRDAHRSVSFTGFGWWASPRRCPRTARGRCVVLLLLALLVNRIVVALRVRVAPLASIEGILVPVHHDVLVVLPDGLPAV